MLLMMAGSLPACAGRRKVKFSSASTIGCVYRVESIEFRRTAAAPAIHRKSIDEYEAFGNVWLQCGRLWRFYSRWGNEDWNIGR